MPEQLNQEDLSKQQGDGDWGEGARKDTDPSDQTLADADKDRRPFTAEELLAMAEGIGDDELVAALEEEQLAQKLSKKQAFDAAEMKAPKPFTVPKHVMFSAASGSPVESSGGDNDYWLLHIAQPKRKDLKPYTVECEDIIEAFEMSFQEGEAFKAIWRKCGERLGNGKPGDTPLRNAEKVEHFGKRMVAIETKKLNKS